MKKYIFKFSAQKATFEDGFVGVAYGLNCRIAEDIKELTFSEALEYLKTFSNGINVSHAAFVTINSESDRKPSGYKQSKTYIYFNASNKG